MVLLLQRSLAVRYGRVNARVLLLIAAVLGAFVLVVTQRNGDLLMTMSRRQALAVATSAECAHAILIAYASAAATTAVIITLAFDSAKALVVLFITPLNTPCWVLVDWTVCVFPAAVLAHLVDAALLGVTAVERAPNAVITDNRLGANADFLFADVVCQTGIAIVTDLAVKRGPGTCTSCRIARALDANVVA